MPFCLLSLDLDLDVDLRLSRDLLNKTHKNPLPLHLAQNLPIFLVFLVMPVSGARSVPFLFLFLLSRPAVEK